MDTTTKINNKTIEVIKTKTEQSVVRYNIDELVLQKKSIQSQKDMDSTQRDTELAEVDDLIQKCTDIGIVANAQVLGDNQKI